MEIKNPIENKNGTIDIEMEHPIHGWIPFTASPNDVEEHGRLLFANAAKGKYGAVKPKAPKEGTVQLGIVGQPTEIHKISI